MPIAAAFIGGGALIIGAGISYFGTRSAASDARKSSNETTRLQLEDAREARALEESQFKRTHALGQKSERRIAADTNFDNYRSLINSAYNMGLNNKTQARQLLEFSESRVKRG